MPTYTYRCNECQKIEEKFNSMADYKSGAPSCHDTKMQLVILTAPEGYVQRDCRYWCPVTNTGVTSWRQRRNVLDEHNLVDANDMVGTQQSRAKKKAATKQKEDAPKDLQSDMQKIFKEEQDKFMRELA